MASAAREPRGGLSMRQTHGGGFQRTGGFERAKGSWVLTTGTSTQTRWMSQTGERKGMGDSYFVTSQNSNEAHKIYLNQGPPTQFVSGREERGKTRDKKKRERLPEAGAPYGHRMDYFMETQDRKAQIQQLEAQNRQLKIEFAKARHEFLELQYKFRQKDDFEEEDDEEEDEKEEYAKVGFELRQKILVMKGEIARYKDQLVLKKRELEGIKLVRRELSEAELTSKVFQIEEICTQLREESVILMRKYPGYREKEGIDAEDNQRYRFGNSVLSEYDELQEELTETLKRVIALKAKKLKDREVRMEQIEKCKEDQMALDGQIAELDTKIDELEADKKRRERYQGEDLGKVKEERESLMHEYAELDKALKELVKDKNAASTFQSKGHSELRNAFEERQKEYERLCRKRRLEEAAAEEEEQLQAQEKPEELTKTESFRAVRSSQVEGCVAVIQRRLALRGVDAEQAFSLLLANDEMAQDPDNMFVTLGSIESSLRKDPFFVPKKDVRMLARYLVEDNSQEMIEFRSDRTQAKIIVKSIFKTLLGAIPKRSPEQLATAFRKIREAILANKDQLLSNLLTIEKKDTLSSQKFTEGIRNVPPNLLELDENLKNLLVMHCIERFEPEDIKLPMLPEIFGEKEITERYIRTSKTKPTQSIASSTVQAPEVKPAPASEPAKGGKVVAHTVTGPTQPATKPAQGKQMVIDSDGEMDSEDDISREEFTPVAKGPPPSLVVNKVDTFNNPETKSKILSLDQIKAASEVKGAFGKLMFGGAAKPAGQEATEGKPAEEKKPAANPLSFILGGNKKGAEGGSSPKEGAANPAEKQAPVLPKPAPAPPADPTPKPSKPAVIFDDEYDEDEEIEHMLSKNKNTLKD